MVPAGTGKAMFELGLGTGKLAAAGENQEKGNNIKPTESNVWTKCHRWSWRAVGVSGKRQMCKCTLEKILISAVHERLKKPRIFSPFFLIHPPTFPKERKKEREKLNHGSKLMSELKHG